MVKVIYKMGKSQRVSKRSIIRDKQCPKCNHKKALVYDTFFKCTKCLKEYTEKDLEKREREIEKVWGKGV